MNHSPNPNHTVVDAALADTQASIFPATEDTLPAIITTAANDTADEIAVHYNPAHGEHTELADAILSAAGTPNPLDTLDTGEILDEISRVLTVTGEIAGDETPGPQLWESIARLALAAAAAARLNLQPGSHGTATLKTAPSTLLTGYIDYAHTFHHIGPTGTETATHTAETLATYTPLLFAH